MDNRTPKENLLIEGLYDWVYASWVTNYIQDFASGHDHLTRVIQLIAEVITEGLMVPG